MSSGMTVKIKLEPFYQDFLRAKFETPQNEVFKFSKGHDLNVKLNFLLSKTPCDYKPVDYGEDTFEIELLYNQEKDVHVYNYLSETKMNVLQRNIIIFFNMMFREEVTRLRHQYGFVKTDTVHVFMDDYKIDPKYHDRIIRSYNRWIEKQSRYKKRKKQK